MAELAESLWLRGEKILTLAAADSELFQYLAQRKIPVLAVKQGLRQGLQLRQILRENPEAAVVVHILRDLKQLRFLLLGLKNPLVGFSHCLIGVQKKDFFHRWIYARVNRLICFSEPQRQNLLEHLPVDSGQIQLIPHGADLNRFRPGLGLHPTLKVDRDLVIGVVGRLDPQKGQMEVLEALGILQRQGLFPRLALVGAETHIEPGERDRLNAKISELELQEQVQFLPFRADVEQIYRDFDIFVMPSHQETFGRVLIEAMASGLPSVATRAGGVPFILRHEQDGLLVEPRSPSSLAAALETLIRNPELRRELGQRARLRIEKFFDRRLIDPQFHRALTDLR